MSMKQILLTGSVALLVSCSNPRSTEIPSVGWEQFSNKKFSNAMNKLDSEERELVNGYLYFVRMYNDTIPKGFTIGNAIDYMIQFRSSFLFDTSELNGQ